MDYLQLWDRWAAQTTLSENDRRAMVDSLHEEVVTGVQALAGLAVGEMGKLLEEAKYDKQEAYIAAVMPVVALAALDGYLLFLMEEKINPLTANLAANDKTKGLGQAWSKKYQTDQNASYLSKADQIVGLLLGKIHELRVNQALSFHPEIVELPYKTTEKLHQYIGWAVRQGYVLGRMEKELSAHG